MCDAILKKLDKLEEKIPDELKQFTRTLQKFDVVLQAACSMVVKPGYEEVIEDFRLNYESLGISTTPSVHTIFNHVKDWYDRHGTDHGLAWYGEEATETCHNDWPKTWIQGYKVTDTHEKYGDNLLAGVAAYNTQRK